MKTLKELKNDQAFMAKLVKGNLIVIDTKEINSEDKTHCQLLYVDSYSRPVNATEYTKRGTKGFEHIPEDCYHKEVINEDGSVSVDATMIESFRYAMCFDSIRNQDAVIGTDLNAGAFKMKPIAHHSLTPSYPTQRPLMVSLRDGKQFIALTDDKQMIYSSNRIAVASTDNNKYKFARSKSLFADEVTGEIGAIVNGVFVASVAPIEDSDVIDQDTKIVSNINPYL